MHALDLDPLERAPVKYTRPLPNINEDIAPFWEGVARHEFLLYRCSVCSAWYWPAAYCRNDHPLAPFQGDMRWAPASGRGRIFATSVHRRVFDPAFEPGYVYALIELEEGPLFATNVVGLEGDHAAVPIGHPVHIVFQDFDDGITLPFAALDS